MVLPVVYFPAGQFGRIVALLVDEKNDEMIAVSQFVDFLLQLYVDEKIGEMIAEFQKLGF